jgi:hypothetical protein
VGRGRGDRGLPRRRHHSHQNDARRDPGGAQIGIFVPTPEKPGPHYLWDEVREQHAADARVVAASADTCKAEIINGTTNGPIVVGDKVIVAIP